MSGGKLVIENNRIRLVRLAKGGELIGLARPDKSRRIRPIKFLSANADNLGAGSGCETSELLKGIL